MEFVKRLFGMADEEPRPAAAMPRRGERTPDERAVERYRYLLRTAPPETIEEAHAEAFARLTPEQRLMVLRELAQTLPPAERQAAAAGDGDPRALARLATRAEMRQPGSLERTWSSMPALPGVGGMGGFMMNNFLGTFAGVMLGSIVADAFLGNAGYDQGYADGLDAADAPDGADGEFADAGFGDAGAGEAGAFGDFGSDLGGFGDFGGDF